MQIIWIIVPLFTWWVFEKSRSLISTKFLTKKENEVRDGSKVINILPAQLLLTLLRGSIKTQLSKADSIFNLGKMSYREFILMLSLSPLSVFLTVSLAVCLFLLGSDFLVGFASVVPADLIYWLVDGRWPNLLLFLGLGACLTFILRKEYWSLIFVLFLLSARITSVSGAVCWVLGERFALVILFLYQSRNSKNIRAIGLQLMLITLLIFFTSFFFLGYAKDFLVVWESDFELNASLKIFEFWILQGFTILIQTIFLMGWGHFAAKKVPA